MSPIRQSNHRYPLPEIIDPPRKCLTIPMPDDPGHTRAFFAAINELAQAWTWEEGVSGKQLAVAKVWETIVRDASYSYYFDEGGCMACYDCYTDVDLTITTINNYGDLILIDYDAFIVTGGTTMLSLCTPGGGVRKDGTNDDEIEQVICWASAFFVKAVAEGIIELGESDNLSLLQKIGNIASVITRFMGGSILQEIAFTPQADAASTLAVSLANTIGALFPEDITPEIVAALNDDTARWEVSCCMQSRLNAAATVINYNGWNILWRDEVAYCDYDDMSANGVIIANLFRTLFNESVDSYVQFIYMLERANFAINAHVLPVCQCTDCADYTVANDELYAYTTFTPAPDSVDEVSGVTGGTWEEVSAFFDYGEMVCISKVELYIRKTSQAHKLFVRWGETNIVTQLNESRASGTWRMNEMPVPPGGVVCSYIEMWAQNRPGESDDPEQSPLLPKGDFICARINQTLFDTEV